MAINSDLNIDVFIEEFRSELALAITRDPQPSNTLAELTAEVGLLAQSMLDIGDGHSKDWWNVWQGAKHVAAMAARCVLDGDRSLGAVPTGDNTK